MILDRPDEDAELTDEEAELESYLDDAPSRPATDAGADRLLPDWPPTRMREVGLNVDASVISWFKATHTDWRREMRAVLAAWVVAQANPLPTPDPSAPDVSADP